MKRKIVEISLEVASPRTIKTFFERHGSYFSRKYYDMITQSSFARVIRAQQALIGKTVYGWPFLQSPQYSWHIVTTENVKIEKLEETPYRCPVCYGSGLVSRPPHIAGDIYEYSSSTTQVAYTCKACAGRGIVWG